MCPCQLTWSAVGVSQQGTAGCIFIRSKPWVVKRKCFSEVRELTFFFFKIIFSSTVMNSAHLDLCSCLDSNLLQERSKNKKARKATLQPWLLTFPSKIYFQFSKPDFAVVKGIYFCLLENMSGVLLLTLRKWKANTRELKGFSYAFWSATGVQLAN